MPSPATPHVFAPLPTLSQPLPPATLIIPQHGRVDLTLACVQSIRRHDPVPWPIILIDDGGPDDSLRQLVQSLQLQSAPDTLPGQPTPLAGSQRLSPFNSATQPLALINQSHQGLTAAWNRAACHATTPILLFLNNDTLATGPFIERLITPLLARAIAFQAVSEILPHAAQQQPPAPHPGCGSEQPGCRSEPPATDSSTSRPARSAPKTEAPRMTGVRLRTERSLPPHLLRHLPTTRFLEGWCFALRREDFLKLNGFDESMRLYWSDTDLQCRLLESNRHTPPQDALAPIPDLPLQHLSHRTTHANPTHRRQWNQDRQAFIAARTHATSPTGLAPVVK